MKSLSNLIKSNYIYFDKQEKRVINSDSKYNVFTPFVPSGEVTDKPEKFSPEAPSEFVEGINVLNMDKLMQKQEDYLKQQAETMLEETKMQADEILQNAIREAESIKQNAYDEARTLGYEDGIKSSEDICNQLKEELQEKLIQNERDYEAHLNKLEPDFVDIMISLMEKITGIMMEDKKDVILYLVDRALKQEDKSNQYIIHVSKEDYFFLETEKDKLMSVVSAEASIEIQEDRTLSKNQCIIEMDTRIIDCSLDVQLNGVLEDLKLLSRI